MTNLCEKAGQFMIEQINEAKSKEEDYKLACNQMNVTESGINSLKSILKNFSSLVDPFSKFIKEFNESIKKIYKNTPFNPYIDKIIYSQELILSELDTLNKEIVKLYSKTSAWNLIFQQAKEQKKLREEKKKKFEHYEQKLQKIEKDAKKKKNDELILRNEQKYRMAASEFVEISGSSLEIINNSLILSWNLINPIISELILTKTKAFNNIIFILNDFSNIKERFEEIKEEEKKKIIFIMIIITKSLIIEKIQCLYLFILGVKEIKKRIIQKILKLILLIWQLESQLIHLEKYRLIDINCFIKLKMNHIKRIIIFIYNLIIVNINIFICFK